MICSKKSTCLPPSGSLLVRPKTKTLLICASGILVAIIISTMIKSHLWKSLTEGSVEAAEFVNRDSSIAVVVEQSKGCLHLNTSFSWSMSWSCSWSGSCSGSWSGSWSVFWSRVLLRVFLHVVTGHLFKLFLIKVLLHPWPCPSAHSMEDKVSCPLADAGRLALFNMSTMPGLSENCNLDPFPIC